MRIIRAAGSLAVVITVVSGQARAQTAGPPPSGDSGGGGGGGYYQKPAPLILEKEQLGTTAFAIVARSRMRNGDCAGALDAFDAAVAHSIEPTLRRDRGMCHEQLGHPFAAIDDYRAYLTEQPDAPDAEGIRGRLGRLEQDNTGRSSTGDDTDIPPSEPANGSASGSLSVGGSTEGGAQVSVGSGGKPRDPMDYVEHDNDQMKSPLRLGRGWSFAPYFSEHKWFFDNTNFGDSQTWAEVVGLQFRYSFGRMATLFLEGGYQRFNSTAATSALFTVQGLSSELGVEFRIPFDAEYDNQLLVAPGLGFEWVSDTANNAGGPSPTFGAFVPKIRGGWRHMVDASAAIDLSLDLGLGSFRSFNNPSDFPFSCQPGEKCSTNALVAVNIGLVWGL
jgi:hypothetical protein